VQDEPACCSVDRLVWVEAVLVQAAVVCSAEVLAQEAAAACSAEVPEQVEAACSEAGDYYCWQVEVVLEQVEVACSVAEHY